MCHWWPSVAPHGPEVPTSVWNLPLGTYLAMVHQIQQSKNK